MNQSNANRRLEKTTACLPIVHGSVAFYLGKKIADEFQTHQWTLYIRGPNNEDISCCIAKVIFQLHPSFAQPVRELTEPPFEVSEKGWGEFEAQIRIMWKDISEQSVILNHFIKLYPPPQPGQDPAIPTLTEPHVPVVAESYDEVVFTNPTESFFRKLQAVSTSPPLQYAHQQHFPSYSDTDDFQALLSAQKFLQEELQMAKQRFALAQAELHDVEESLAAIGADPALHAPSKSAAAAVRSMSGAGVAVSKSSTGGIQNFTSGKTKKSSSSAVGQAAAKKPKASSEHVVATGSRATEPGSGASSKQPPPLS